MEAAGRVALDEHLGDLDGLIGEWLTVNSDGSVVEEEDPEQPDGNIAATLKVARSCPRLQVFALVSDRGGELRAFARLSEAYFRSKLERNVIGSIEKHGFDGIVLNLEDPAAVEEVWFRTLLEELRAQLDRAKTLAVMVPGDSSLDYQALSAIADLVLVQLFTDDDAVPRPIAPKYWTDRVTALRALDIPPQKLIFAIASLARDWFNEEIVQVTSFDWVMRAASAPSAKITFDPESGNPLLQYVDADGYFHHVWFLDAVTAFNQIGALAPLRPRGVALWELGSEDQSVWQFFKRGQSWRPPDPSVLEKLRSDYLIETIDKGEVYRFLSRPVAGRRSISVTSGSEITFEEYQAFPRSWQIEAVGISQSAIVLTFDDGPEPEYTTRILDILKKERVQATFFVTGWQSLKHPGVIKRIVAEGHELGNHSWSHPDLSRLPDKWVDLELDATQRLLQVLTGVSVRLFRPPYASDAIATTAREARVTEIASRNGYLSVGANLNPEDWRGKPKEEIVREIVEKAQSNEGSVIELHDAGGDRTNTVEALPELISALKHDGFRFVTISDMIGQAGSWAVPLSDHDTGWVAAAGVGFEGMSIGHRTFKGLLWACIIISLLRFLIIFVFALRDHWSPKTFSKHFPSVSIIVPAYNEEKVIVRTVDCLLRSDYPNVCDILVVDDGSADNTAAVVEREFVHEPRVRVFRRPNAGKSEALNFGLEQTRSEVIVMLDADTLLQPDAIRLMARHFGDPHVGAVAGNAKVGNRLNVITKLQALEYLTSQNLERAGLAGMDAITVVPGAVGAWRREVVLRAGGFSPTTLAEDCDLTLCIHRLGYRVEHELSAIGWTEAPETWAAFMRQRFRWIYGTLQAAYRHTDTVLRPRYGAWAYFSLPSIILFTVLLPLVSPIVDLILIVAIISAIADLVMHPESYSMASLSWALGVYFFVFAIDVLIAVLAFTLERNENLRLLAYLPLQRVFYRQVLYVIVLRVLLSCLRGNAQRWNKLARLGSVVLQPAAP